MTGALIPAFRAPLRAGFLEARKLSDSGGRAIQASVGTDTSLNTYVAWTESEGIVLNQIDLDSVKEFDFTDPGLGSGDPAFSTNSMGTTYLVFTQDDPLGGREIYLAATADGAIVRAPENISMSTGDDYAPKLCLDLFGQPHVVWTEQLGNRTLVIYRPPGRAPLVLGPGAYPGIAMDSTNTVHIVYTRNRDLYMVQSHGGSIGAETPVTRTPSDEEFFPSIAVSDSGVVYVAYELKGTLYLLESDPGSGRFGPPSLLDSGGITTPDLRIAWGYLSIVYEKQGDLYYILGRAGGVLVNPVHLDPTVNTPAAETRPSLAVDSRGVLHLAFIRDGEVYYTNNSGMLTLQFTAQVIQGEVPLEVHFIDLSSGAVERWTWTFGDDSLPSNERNPVHTYTKPGKYDVSLEVLGTGTREFLEKKDYIFAQDADNKLWIPNQSIFPGEEGIWFPVITSHKGPMKAFQVSGTFDPNVLTLRDISRDLTALQFVSAEFWAPNFSNDPSGTYFFAAVILDYGPPWDDQTLPPSTSQILTQLVFDCSKDAPQGGTTVVELKNGVGPNDSYNVFKIGDFSVIPALNSSIISIVPLGDPAPASFQRGDADGSASVDISDAIAILAYLFIGGTIPRCQDAADINDSGNIDIADIIYLLSFEYLGGSPPFVPFPNSGLDPTEDDLEDCTR